MVLRVRHYINMLMLINLFSSKLLCKCKICAHWNILLEGSNKHAIKNIAKQQVITCEFLDRLPLHVINISKSKKCSWFFGSL